MYGSKSVKIRIILSRSCCNLSRSDSLEKFGSRSKSEFYSFKMPIKTNPDSKYVKYKILKI